MHDLHLADRILEQVLNHAKKNKLKKVTGITIELGRIEEHGAIISPDNLCFNLNLLAKNTSAEGARLEIRETTSNDVKVEEIEGLK